MLFYVFLLFMYLPNMVFLMISWVRTPNHIPKSGIWFASHSYGLEIMLLIKKQSGQRRQRILKMSS